MATGQLHLLLEHLRATLALRDAVALTDGQLLERFVTQRDEAAFEVLVRRHGTMVWNVCRRVLRHEQDAEDAFQAAFLTLSRKANSISQRECVAGWLYRVTHRLALELKGSCVKYSARLTPLGDVAGAVSEMHVWRDTRYVLDEELQKLPAKYRDPFVLCYLEGKTNDQAAR